MKFLLLAAAFVASSPAFAAMNMRSRATVIQGALIRAGGPGGAKSAPAQTIQSLCEEGVRKVFYLYPEENFSTRGNYSCSKGTTEYLGGAFRGPQVKGVLTEVAKSANEGKGPVLVHCWNGWHAAGEISALALIQFCDWSGERAANYWVDGIKDKGNLGKYGSIINRIRSFRPIPGLRLSDSAKASRCP